MKKIFLLIILIATLTSQVSAEIIYVMVDGKAIIIDTDRSDNNEGTDIPRLRN